MMQPTSPIQMTIKQEVPQGRDWRDIGNKLVDQLRVQLEAEGLRATGCPDIPRDPSVKCIVVDGLYRVLYMWVPFDAYTEDAGKFMVRADVLTRKWL